jgi:hypothetical protein
LVARPLYEPQNLGLLDVSEGDVASGRQLPSWSGLLLMTNQLIADHGYLEAAGHGADENGSPFRPIKNNRTKTLKRALTPNGVYTLVRTSAQLEFKIRPYALRATAATNALDPRPISPRCRSGSDTPT